jgi:hypothetical protein
MMEQLPEGKSIGWMQAPPQWIFSHTLRFVGIVRIVIQDGEGFILINKGKVLGYYFKHGRIELRGNAALDYFNSNPTVEFNLSKYTPEEMAEAMKICNIEPEPEVKKATVQSSPAIPPEPVTIKTRATTPAVKKPAGEGMEKPGPAVAEKTVVPVEIPGAADESLYEPPRPAPAHVPPAIPQPAFLEEPDIKIIGQIKKLNGIVAISVFNEDRNILLMGDVEIEPLLKIARSLLETTKKVTPHLDWGPFVHMTLQIPEGNIIIAPYRSNYLCLLTTRTINIGHIRRILRDIQITEDARESS